eukprot:gene14420-19082_t
MSALTPWPPALAGTPAVAVIEQAIARRRLSHSLLLHGDDPDTLVAIALAIADRLLNGAEGSRAAATFPPDQHPDCFSLRPAGKMRQISADATRDPGVLIADAIGRALQPHLGMVARTAKKAGLNKV